MAHVTLNSYTYLMKAYSVSFEVVQTVFQNYKKCPSYDALNKDMHSKRTKKEIFNRAFLRSHTSNLGEIPLDA